MRSEIRPAIGAPTSYVEKNGDAGKSDGCVCGSEIKLTQVPNTSWYEARAYQRLVVYVVTLTLCYIVRNPFPGRRERECESNL